MHRYTVMMNQKLCQSYFAGFIFSRLRKCCVGRWASCLWLIIVIVISIVIITTLLLLLVLILVFIINSDTIFRDVTKPAKIR